MVDEKLAVGLLAVDVPRQLGRGEGVAGGARHVDPVADVVARVAAADLGATVGDVCMQRVKMVMVLRE